MSDELDSMGPVDYLVVEFPDARLARETLPSLVDLVDRGVVRVLDLVFVRKEADESVVAVELADFDQDGRLDLRVLDGASSGLLTSDDITEVGAVLNPGTAAAVVLYENTWAAPFVSALHKAGAELVASGRIPVPALLEALDAAEAAEAAESLDV